MRLLSTMISVADDFNASGVSGRTLVHKITKSVCCFKSVGSQKASYEWKQLHNLTQQNKYAERAKRCVIVPGTIFGGAFRQKLTGATLPNNNSINPKNNIVSKQFPCWQEDTWRLYKKKSEDGFDREKVLTACRGNVSARTGFAECKV